MHAGTNANVFATIYGENGDSGERKLQKSEKHLDKFERNQVRTLLQIIESGIADSIRIIRRDDLYLTLPKSTILDL